MMGLVAAAWAINCSPLNFSTSAAPGGWTLQCLAPFARELPAPPTATAGSALKRGLEAQGLSLAS